MLPPRPCPLESGSAAAHIQRPVERVRSALWNDVQTGTAGVEAQLAQRGKKVYPRVSAGNSMKNLQAISLWQRLGAIASGKCARWSAGFREYLRRGAPRWCARRAD